MCYVFANWILHTFSPVILVFLLLLSWNYAERQTGLEYYYRIATDYYCFNWGLDSQLSNTRVALVKWIALSHAALLIRSESSPFILILLDPFLLHFHLVTFSKPFCKVISFLGLLLQPTSFYFTDFLPHGNSEPQVSVYLVKKELANDLLPKECNTKLHTQILIAEITICGCLHQATLLVNYKWHQNYFHSLSWHFIHVRLCFWKEYSLGAVSGCCKTDNYMQKSTKL